MEWTQLKVAEAGWDLSLSQMNLLTERVYQKATGPKTFYFPILKPLLAVAAIAVLLFGLLLLWPKKPIEEQVVTLPGSSSAAKPDEYVEKKPSKEEDSSKEQGTDKEETDPEKEQSSEGQKDTENEEKLPVAGGEQEEKEEDETNKSRIHRFWETEKEMPYEEAVAIVKEKLENRPYETLTDKERMAYYQCISNTLYARYKDSLKNYKENGPPNKNDIHLEYHPDEKAPFFKMQLITTESGVGIDLLKEYPLIFNDSSYKIIDIKSPDKINEITENFYAQNQYVEFIEQENGSILDVFYGEIILKHGTGRGTYYFNFENINVFETELSEKTIQEIVQHYLSLDFVTWLHITCDYQYKIVD